MKKFSFALFGIIFLISSSSAFAGPCELKTNGNVLDPFIVLVRVLCQVPERAAHVEKQAFKDMNRSISAIDAKYVNATHHKEVNRSPAVDRMAPSAEAVLKALGSGF